MHRSTSPLLTIKNEHLYISQALVAWLCVVGLAAIIYFLSNQANSSTLTQMLFGSLNTMLRKLAHVSEFIVLYICIEWALSTTFKHEKNIRDPMLQLGAACVTLLFAASDEWHQSFIPGRRFSWLDLSWDTLGLFLGFFISRLPLACYSLAATRCNSRYHQ